ncbi:MAG: EAL domain-containing protein [Armatimonadota bacterium]|nr:EAL domain-containing protein [bacterium]
MRILIAEDDPVSRRLLEALLKKWGYDVVVAQDGRQAWDILKKNDAPKMAIVDWMMPELDGVQVCQNVRQREDDYYIYIILLTAKSQKQDIIQGMVAGADDYVTKPFDANELNARLRAGRRILDLQSELLSTRETLRVQATHDPLTGLPNRLLFSDRLTQRLAQARRQEQPLAVMFLDLDRFKLINDTLGHNIGDMLLKSVSERLQGTLREVDTIARMGGDEFTIILSDIDNADSAVVVADKVLQALAEPVILDGHELFVSASMGISLFPSDGGNAETLVQNADTAMYRAKEQGRNNYQLYTEAFNAAAVEKITLEHSLRRALARDEFLLHYQPQVSIGTGKVKGTEALIRWRQPNLGLVSPGQFIPLAEETGLILPISEWVLRTACTQNKAWQDAGLPHMSIAVNISARQFEQNELTPMVENALEESGLDPRYLDLELTESTLMQNPDTAVSILQKLKDMGVRISVDDFGTGYSSLSYLKRFPIDAVKIDQSFVKDITSNPDDAAIAGAVVAMAHSLKLEVIAEGVETLDQLEFLRGLRCDEMQGYFVSPPVPAEDLQQQIINGLSVKPSQLPFAA